MRAHPIRGILLALVLVFGQWLNFAHAREDASLLPHGHCEYCVHAQALIPGLAEVPKAALPESVHETPADLAARSHRAATVRYYLIRGPPCVDA